MNKTFVVVAVALTIAAPAFSKPDAKTAAKGQSKAVTISSTAEKQKIFDQIRQGCRDVTNTQHGKNIQGLLDLAQQNYDLAAKYFGKESPEMVWPEFTIGHLLGNNRDSKNAIPHLEHAYALATKYPNNPCMRAKEIELWLFKAYLRGGKHKQATALVAGTIDEFERTNNFEKLQDYALVYLRNGACDQSDLVMRRATACCSNDDRKLLKLLQTHSMILLRCRRFKEAIPIAEKKKELLRGNGDQTGYADTVRELGQLSDLAERFDQSSKYYKEAIQLFRAQKRDKYLVAKLLQDYSRVERNLGHTAAADALKKESEDLKFGTN